jgi:hypothetical protein
MSNLVTNGPTYEPDHLFVSSKVAVLTKGITIKEGVVAKRGSVIALEADTQKGIVADKTSTGAVLQGILTDDVNASEGDCIATIYLSGEFNADALMFAEGTVLADYEQELRKLGMYTQNVKEAN